MTKFDEFKSMSIEELVDWLDEHGEYDGSPWGEWFTNNFCNNCPAIECTYAEYWGKPEASQHKVLCAYCELEDKCKFFPELDHNPDNKEIIKMWLMLEAKDDD
jgi:hypothetical protein